MRGISFKSLPIMDDPLCTFGHIPRLIFTREKLGFALAVRQIASLKDVFNLESLLANRDRNDKIKFNGLLYTAFYHT